MEIQEGICPVCGKPTKLIKKGLYRKYCSYACRNYILNKTILKDKEKENLNKIRNSLIQNKKENSLKKYKKLYTTGHILKYDTDFLKSLDNSVIDHAKIFDNKKLEVDFYIPIKNIAFEFDGTYWHCDPRFYNEDFFNKVKNKTAKEIWEKDAEKDQLCLDKNVILYRVKEYDWKNDKDRIKQEIKNLIGIKDV